MLAFLSVVARFAAPRTVSPRSVAAIATRSPASSFARSGARRGTARHVAALVLLTSSAAPPSLVATLGTITVLTPRPAVAADGAVLDIDTADAETLAAALPGIGPVKARRIVEHRERHGPFDTLEALLEVKGIGPATLARIRSYLEGETGETVAAPSRGSAAGVTTGSAARPLSTSELERDTRAAVRRLVLAAERDAAPYR